MHRRNHTGEKPFACPDCDRKFTSGYLNVHRRNYTGEKPFACSECDKKFTTSGYLNVHRRNHTGEKPFACSDCDKKFTTSGHLNVHRRNHNGEKPFACPDCDKKFTARNYLNVHCRIHTGEKPFACPDCDMDFRLSGHLDVHRKIHIGEKPFACSDCDKKFTQSFTLKAHRRIHSGEKPFVCEDCDKTFSRRSNMESHRRRHTCERSLAGRESNCSLEHNNEFNILHGKPNTAEQLFSPILVCPQNVDLGQPPQLLQKMEKPFGCHVCDELFSQQSLLENQVIIHPDAEDFICERKLLNFKEQRKLSVGPEMPVHTREVSIVPSECNMICSASSGNCVLESKVDDGDLHMNANKLLDSSDACTGNEESSTKKEDTDSFKLYGCGICCQ